MKYSYGWVLRGDGTGSFTAVPPTESGVYVSGEVRAIEPLDTASRGFPRLLVARNDAPLVVLKKER